jgi:hypothetical protein
MKAWIFVSQVLLCASFASAQNMGFDPNMSNPGGGNIPMPSGQGYSPGMNGNFGSRGMNGPHGVSSAVDFKGKGCPFAPLDQDLSAALGSLSFSLGNQLDSKGGCPQPPNPVAATYVNRMMNGSSGGMMGEPSCIDDYESLYRAEYSFAVEDFITGAAPDMRSDYAACAGAGQYNQSPTDAPNRPSLTREVKQCYDSLLGRKIRNKKDQCARQKVTQVQMSAADAVQNVTGTITAVLNNTQCTDENVRRQATLAGIAIASSHAATVVGGAAGLGVAALSDLVVAIGNSLSLSKTKKLYKDSKRAMHFSDSACLFYAVQKMMPFANCGLDVDRAALNELERQHVEPNCPSCEDNRKAGQKIGETFKAMKKLSDKSLEDQDLLNRYKGLQTQLNLQDLAGALKRDSDYTVALGRAVDDLNSALEPKSVKRMGAQKSAERTRSAVEQLESLSSEPGRPSETGSAPTDVPAWIHDLMVLSRSSDPDSKRLPPAYQSLLSEEDAAVAQAAVNELLSKGLRKRIEAGEAAIGQELEGKETAFKGAQSLYQKDFEDTVKAKVLALKRLPMSRSTHKAREVLLAAEASLNEILSICMDTASMFLYDHTKHSASVDRYPKACREFQCADGTGIPKMSDREKSPEYFRGYQCRLQSARPKVVKALAGEYAESKKICGRHFSNLK